MQILHLVGRSHRRGAEQVALELAAELRSRGHHNQLMAVGLGHEGGREIALPPLLTATRQGAVQVVAAARRLRGVLAAQEAPVDVVLAHGATAALVAVLASPRRGPALVWQRILGLTDSSFHGFRGVCWRTAVRRVDGVVVLTAQMEEEVRRLGYQGPVWRLPNGRRTERFEDLDRDVAGTELRASLGVDGHVGLVGLVGYLVAQKQPEEAVDVAAALDRAGHEVHLVVAGSGPNADAVAQRAHTLGVGGRVSLLGHRNDVAAILGGLDVLILTSRDEGIPGVVVEAAMAGCPVVTYPVGGVAEVVEDGVTGQVLTTSTAAAMATAVGGLLQDPGRLRSMGTAARDRSGAYALGTIAARYEELLADRVARVRR